ncbi:MAG: efflux RND transporter permease subunit [bacterium]|nr:efflux RND transporter permease subunit [bacterium]
MNPAKFGLHHRHAIALVAAILAFAGIESYLVLTKAIFPKMAFARIDVSVTRGDTPAAQMNLQIARPLQAALALAPGIESVHATSAQGNVDLVAAFYGNTDPHADLQAVTQAISTVSGSLPSNAQVTARIISTNFEPILSYAFDSHSVSRTILREEIERRARSTFTGIAGMSRFMVVGGRPREFAVDVDPLSLAAHHLTINDVEQAIAGSSAVQSIGHGEQGYLRISATVNAHIDGARKISDIPLAVRNGTTLHVGDAARVHLSVAPPQDQASANGKQVVALSFYAQQNADVVNMADAIYARTPGFVAALPAGAHVSKYWDQTTLIRDSQKTLRDSILIGAALAVAVIFFFLGSWQVTAIAAFVIPMAMLVTFVFMRVGGESINLMSAGGLAVAIGLIIDDAIVIIENIERNLAMGKKRIQAIVDASGQISGAMAASTTTILVVFLPLTLVSGVSGSFFRALAITLAVSIIASLLLALFLAPILAERFLPELSEKPSHNKLLTWLLNIYEPVLRGALAKPWKAYLVGGISLAVTMAGFLMLPSGFLPRMDEGAFELSYNLPPGTSLQETTRVADGIERMASALPGVTAQGNYVGIDTNGFAPLPQNYGVLRVTLHPVGTRPSIQDLMGRLRDEVSAAYPNVYLDFHQVLEDMINGLTGAPAPIEVTLAGPNHQVLIGLAPKVAAALSKTSGVHDVFDGVVYENPALDVQPQLGLPAGLGLTAADFNATLQAAVAGTVVAEVSVPPHVVPIRVRYAPPWRFSPDQFAQIPIVGANGAVATLGSLAALDPTPPLTDVYEVDGQPQDVITANYTGSLSGVISRMKANLAKTSLPPGYSVKIGGAYASQQQSFKEFALVAVVAIMLVFVVMVFTFRSFREPLTIMIALPLSLVGVVLGLLVTRTPFNVSSFMGLILLVGLVVKNGILLLDAAHKELASGAKIDDALVAAGRVRLRPIVMTALAAIGGLLPLAIGAGAGSEMEKPLAIAVIGGLSTATIFTLGIIPTFYAKLAKRTPA